jgi:hypothetical protein
MSENTPNVTPDAADAAAQVDLVLARAGLPVTAEERERLARIYPSISEWTSALRLPETREAEPALIYPATFER